MWALWTELYPEKLNWSTYWNPTWCFLWRMWKGLVQYKFSQTSYKRSSLCWMWSMWPAVSKEVFENTQTIFSQSLLKHVWKYKFKFDLFLILVLVVSFHHPCIDMYSHTCEVTRRLSLGKFFVWSCSPYYILNRDQFSMTFYNLLWTEMPGSLCSTGKQRRRESKPFFPFQWGGG